MPDLTATRARRTRARRRDVGSPGRAAHVGDIVAAMGDFDSTTGGGPETSATDYDVLVIGSGLRRVRDRAAPDREGLPGRGPRGRPALRRRGLRQDLLAGHATTCGPRSWAAPASSGSTGSTTSSSWPAPGSAAGRWSTPTRSTCPARRFFTDPHWAHITDWADELPAVLRPGRADARRRHQPDDDRRGRGLQGRRRRDGRRAHVQDAPRSASTSATRPGATDPGPLLRRRRARSAPAASSAASA